ncbi:MAG: hypothetical protein M1814_006141 [Vezdaea aestivalis]|nr:MAG: hypothetical protein M1814_006141 [Vezdaea aestivalis]
MYSPDELAQFQKLSNDYEPELPGPLLGKRLDTHVLTSEFAAADPVFIQKTQALPEIYPEYRVVKGDGNCGWRALAFSYCEALLHHSSPSKILEEETRLKSLNNLLASAGNPLELCEDFVDETVELVHEISNHLSNPSDDAFLVDAFNDIGKSSAIITHVKLLTSSWMKTHATEYEQFLSGQTVAEYCSQQINPYQVEMEHLGLNAMIDVLVKPAGFSVEVSYLDRSATTEVNVHRFEAATPNGPTLCLLYRPGHYDILYKRPENLNINLSRYSMSLQTDHNSPPPTVTPEMQNWFTLPGSSLLSLQSSADHAGSSSGEQTHLFLQSPTSPNLSDPFGSSANNAQSTLQTRPSRYEQPGYYPSQAVQLPLQTPSFKNSHYNPAHYGNKGFQPEIWTPETEGSSRSR